MHLKTRFAYVCLLFLFIFSKFPLKTAADSAIAATDSNPVASDSSGIAGDSNQETVIVYFYISPCSSCDKVAEFLNTLDSDFMIKTEGTETPSALSIKKINIGDSENFELATEYFLTYRVPASEQAAPIVFIGDAYLSGEEKIILQLSGMIEAGYGLDTVLPENITMPERASQTKETDYLSNYQAAGVFLTGLINGFNPCSLSILLFFLSMITARAESVLKLGFSFIAGKFIAYIALGTLFYGIFGSMGGEWFDSVNFVVKILLLIVAGVLVVMYIRDFFAVKNEKYEKEKMQLPSGLRKFNHQLIKKFAGIHNMRLLIPISFGLGAFIAVGEFLCTGQIYLATIIYMLRNSETINMRAAVYFLIYGVAFVSPLIVITLLIHKGKEVFDISEIVRGKLHIIKLLNAIIFLAFALIVLFFF